MEPCDLSGTDVAILAGGLGTRLQSVLPDMPKVLAPIAGKPFLHYMLDRLCEQGVCRVVLCLGHHADLVIDYVRNTHFPLTIEYVVEPKPLGTAGAVAFARARLRSDPSIVMNGDTFVDADLGEFLEAHRRSAALVSILSAHVENGGRYGRLEIDDGNFVIRFVEKDHSHSAACWINAGVYLFGAKVLDRIARTGTGSLERDVLEKMPSRVIHAFRSPGRFVDIGTPEMLASAHLVVLDQ